MLSILLPVYNFDVRQLVAGLGSQCEATGIAWEIVCFDDGSSNDFKKINREVAAYTNVVYQEMPKNLGRAAIRNALASAARFPYLLFMDCDSKIVREDYIQQYLDHLDPGSLVYGGRCYSPTPPANEALFFHWYYGTHREQRTQAQRSAAPYHSFMTNNFLIPKNIFLSIRFDESLTRYGHEDTLFGMELARQQIPIVHIDNPLEHAGLEPVETFLEKTGMALENLAMLVDKGAPIESRLLQTYRWLQRHRFVVLLRWIYRRAAPWLESKLKGCSPSLFLFDFYKLGYFCEIQHTAR